MPDVDTEAIIEDFRKRNFGAASQIFQEERDAGWTPRQKQVAKVVEAPAADAAVGFLIAANSVVLILQTNVKGEEVEMPFWLTFCSIALLLVFSIELFARMFVYRKFFFQNSWNTFDFFVVGSDIISEVLGLLFENSTVIDLSFMRVFRILRLLRLVEFLTVFAELNRMVRLMLTSARVMLWGTILLLITVTLWAIVAVELLQPLNKELAQQGAYEDCERCARAYGNVYQSILTFFQSLVFGDSWGRTATKLIEAHPWTACVLVAAGVTILPVLNIMLAVIVDKAHEQHENDAANRLLEKERLFLKAKEKLLKICDSIDANGDGEISADELVRGYDENPELATILSLMNIYRPDITTLFSILDEDCSGAVTSLEFVDQLHKMKTQDSHTRLLFVQGYVNDLRMKMLQQIEKLDTDITQKIDRLLYNQEKYWKVTFEEARKCQGSEDPGPMLRSDASVQPLLLRLENEFSSIAQKLSNTTEKLEAHAIGSCQQGQVPNSLEPAPHTVITLDSFGGAKPVRPSGPSVPLSPKGARPRIEPRDPTSPDESEDYKNFEKKILSSSATSRSRSPAYGSEGIAQKVDRMLYNQEILQESLQCQGSQGSGLMLRSDASVQPFLVRFENEFNSIAQKLSHATEKLEAHAIGSFQKVQAPSALGPTPQPVVVFDSRGGARPVGPSGPSAPMSLEGAFARIAPRDPTSPDGSEGSGHSERKGPPSSASFSSGSLAHGGEGMYEKQPPSPLECGAPMKSRSIPSEHTESTRCGSSPQGPRPQTVPREVTSPKLGRVVTPRNGEQAFWPDGFNAHTMGA